MTIYLSDSTNPFFNLATEDCLYQNALIEEPLLFLWRNEKTVVIGRAQNPWVECNIKAMNENNVHLARRQTGGGTVFHDLGNTNFTFLSPKNLYDKTRNLKIITDALQTFDIKAEASGRNDILVQQKKVSGSAFRESKDRAFHHGTLLLNANLTELSNYLNPSAKKLKAKGVKSVRSRVLNLSDINPLITHEGMCEAITQEFINHYGPHKTIHLNSNELSREQALQAHFKQLQDWDWRFGKTLKFEHELNERFEWGEVTVNLNVNHAIITAVKIYSDCLFPDLLESISKQLVGVGYTPEDITHALKKLSNPKPTKALLEFSNWLCFEIN